MAELKKILADAGSRGQKVTFRAGAHAFDAQALGEEIVISMDAPFSRSRCSRKALRCRWKPGAPWGEIVKELQKDRLVPAGTVTSSAATAGGTLAADCLSRFSPRYGKEATWVESFSLLTLDGKTLECKRPPQVKRVPPWSDEEEMFMAAVGGFGYLGAIVSITYRVLSFETEI